MQISLKYLLVFLLFVCSAYAEETALVIDPSTSSYVLTQHIQYFEDTSGNVSIEQIRELKDEFWGYRKNYQFRHTDSAIWLRLTINFNGSDKNWFLSDEKYAKHLMTLYLPTADGYEAVELGSDNGFKNRPKQRTIVYPLKPTQETETYYIRIKSWSPILCLLRLEDTFALMYRDTVENVALSFFYGAAVLIVFFHLLLFFRLNRKYTELLWFCAYVTCFTLFGAQMCGHYYMYFGLMPSLRDFGIDIENQGTFAWLWICLASVFFVCFANRALALSSFTKYSKIIVAVWIAISATTVLVGALSEKYASAAISLWGLGKCILMAYILYVCIQMARKGNYYALFFGIAIVFTSAGILSTVLLSHGIIDLTFWTSNLLIFVAILEYIAMSLCIGTKITDVEKKLQQEQRRHADNMITFTQELQAQTKQLQIEKENAEMANKAKTEFLGSLSHELKTPLNTICGFTDVLLDTELSKGQQESLGYIKDASKNLNCMVGDLLDLASITSRKVTLDKAEFHYLMEMKKRLGEYAKRAEDKGLLFEFNTQNEIEFARLVIEQDIRRYFQVISNLVENAIKYTHQGRIAITLSLQPVDYDKTKITFRIQDSGIGIPKSKQEFIFDIFQQASQSRNRNYEGFGVGLSVAKNIANAMDGDIVVESEENRGSIFEFTLTTTSRIDNVNKYADDLGEEIELLNVPLKILYVEDRRENQVLLSAMLGKTLFELDLISDGQSGVDAHKAAIDSDSPYDLIFLDIHMPGMDGFECFQQIKKIDPFVPVYAISADQRLEVRRQAQREGFNGYIDKPVQMRRLFNIINTFIKEREIGRQQVHDLLSGMNKLS